MVMVINKGREIVETNFWQTSLNQQGSFYCSVNDRAFRLLVDTTTSSEVNPTIEAAINATDIVVSRGCWYDNQECLEFLFTNATHAPFVLFFYTDQIDHMPPETDEGREFNILIYDRNKKAFDSKCNYRRVNLIPCYEPFVIAGT